MEQLVKDTPTPVPNTENASQNFAATPDTNATQRLSLDAAGVSEGRPQRANSNVRTANGGNRQPNPQRRPPAKKKRAAINQREKITLIILGSIALVLILAVVFAVSSCGSAPADDGRIFKGVIAASVDLGGMTREQAQAALEEATANTYTQLDMMVTVLDTTIALSPSATGAKLDIAAVVEDAYNYGRTGSRSEQQQAREYAQNNSVTISILPYLNLNTDYIREEINKLGSQFSSTLTQPTHSLAGEKPKMNVSKPDTSKVHQTITIYKGTAEYGLETGKLYEQVLEYYNINIFQVVGTCTVVAPDSIEDKLDEYYEDLCVEPVDAQLDPATYDVIPEVYGYGFDLDKAKMDLANAPYGTTLVIELRYLEPNLTQDLISDNLFKDILGDYTVPLGIEAAWTNNVTLACKAINGIILKSGDEFSFNNTLGLLTKEKGYMESMVYQGKKAVNAMGGGVTQVASVLYNCTLEAELEILERRNHTYATSFIEVGRDVYVNIGESDFRFRNTLPDLIRIEAEVVNNAIQIRILGTDSREYRVEIDTEVLTSDLPGTLYTYMIPNNPNGYLHGQVLVTPLIGYEVELLRMKIDKETNKLIFQDTLGTYKYQARDAVVVQLKEPETIPTEPSIPGTDSTDPSIDPGTESTDPSVDPGTESTDPTTGSEPIEDTTPEFTPTDQESNEP